MEEIKDATVENSRERRRKKPKEKKDDTITKMMFTQLLLCAVTVAMIFAVSKTGGGTFDTLKQSYEKYTQKDMSVSQLWQEVKNVTKTVVKKQNATDKLGVTKVNITDRLDSSLAKGGDDEEVFAPTNTTLFAPFMVSTTICTPVSGRISSPFGYRINPITGVWSFHSGLDIAASAGEEIKAAYYGTVTAAGYDDAAGNYVILKHSGGLVTKYMHCSKLLVKEGESVRKGEAIALVGTTGMSTGPHLHFIIEVNGKKVNPLYVLNNDGTSV